MMETVVTRIEQVNTKKYRIYLNDEAAFLLYPAELRKYQIRENMVICQELMDEIISAVLSKRAKLRCMYILKSMDKTEAQLRTKLKQDEYPQNVIDEAIEYVRSFHYIDDHRYAINYIEAKKEQRSRQQIRYDLMAKGIDTQTIDDAWEECGDHDEIAQILYWAEKKNYNPEQTDQKQQQKFYQFLLRKGFSLSDIKKALT